MPTADVANANISAELCVTYGLPVNSQPGIPTMPADQIDFRVGECACVWMKDVRVEQRQRGGREGVSDPGHVPDRERPVSWRGAAQPSKAGGKRPRHDDGDRQCGHARERARRDASRNGVRPGVHVESPYSKPASHLQRSQTSTVFTSLTRPSGPAALLLFALWAGFIAWLSLGTIGFASASGSRIGLLPANVTSWTIVLTAALGIAALARRGAPGLADFAVGPARPAVVAVRVPAAFLIWSGPVAAFVWIAVALTMILPWSRSPGPGTPALGSIVEQLESATAESRSAARDRRPAGADHFCRGGLADGAVVSGRR